MFDVTLNLTMIYILIEGLGVYKVTAISVAGSPSLLSKFSQSLPNQEYQRGFLTTKLTQNLKKEKLN